MYIYVYVLYIYMGVIVHDALLMDVELHIWEIYEKVLKCVYNYGTHTMHRL